jgi:hypothetical protein
MRKQAKDELEEMFEELGELEEVRALTRKKVLSDALRKAMKAQSHEGPKGYARRDGTPDEDEPPDGLPPLGSHRDRRDPRYAGAGIPGPGP